ACPRARADRRSRGDARAARARSAARALLRPGQALPGARHHACTRRLAARRAALRAPRARVQAATRGRPEDRHYPRGRAPVAFRPRRLAVPQPSLSISARIGRVPVRPYGTWPSPLDADTIAGIPGSGLSALSVAWPSLRWLEPRPSEGGRLALVEWRD